MCKALLEEFRVAPAMYQVGRTKLFFRAGVLGHLEDTWARIQRSAATKLTECPMTAGACRRLEGQVHALHCCSAQVYNCSLTIACSVLSRQTQAAQCCSTCMSTNLLHKVHHSPLQLLQILMLAAPFVCCRTAPLQFRADAPEHLAHAARAAGVLAAPSGCCAHPGSCQVRRRSAHASAAQTEIPRPPAA